MRGGSRASGMRAGHQRARLREGNRAKGMRAGHQRARLREGNRGVGVHLIFARCVQNRAE